MLSAKEDSLMVSIWVVVELEELNEMEANVMVCRKKRGRKERRKLIRCVCKI